MRWGLPATKSALPASTGPIATMNRHAEAEGRPYFGVEVRQDQIVDPARHALWAERLARIANQLAIALGA